MRIRPGVRYFQKSADEFVPGTIGNKKPFPRPGDPDIGQPADLLLRPPSRRQPVEAQEENASIVESFHAVDGRDRHAFRGDIIGSLGPVVFRNPVVQEAFFVQPSR
jgi:hypothetical protein